MSSLKKSPLILIAFFSLMDTGWSGLEMFFDPADLSVTATGADQIVDIGILIRWDGNEGNTLSGFTLGFNEDSPDLQIIENMGFPPGHSDFTWTNSGVNATSISGSNLANHTIDMSGTQLLGTLQFLLDGSLVGGMIPIELTLTNALRDGLILIPASEVTVTGGTLNVAAVPEPASLAMMGLAACGALGFRRRRKGSQIEQVSGTV